jgi:hypothetical protein
LRILPDYESGGVFDLSVYDSVHAACAARSTRKIKSYARENLLRFHSVPGLDCFPASASRPAICRNAWLSDSISSFSLLPKCL